MDPGKSIRKEINYSLELVLKLMSQYLNKFYILFMNSWYFGIQLFEKLRELKTGAVGIIKKTRKGFCHK